MDLLKTLQKHGHRCGAACRSCQVHGGMEGEARDDGDPATATAGDDRGEQEGGGGQGAGQHLFFFLLREALLWKSED